MLYVAVGFDEMRDVEAGELITDKEQAVDQKLGVAVREGKQLK